MIDGLTGLRARGRKPGSVYDIVKPAFQQFEEVGTSDTCLSGGFVEHASELSFVDAVYVSSFLFLLKLDAVIREAAAAALGTGGAPRGSASGTVAGTVDSAFRRVATLALQKELFSL